MDSLTLNINLKGVQLVNVKSEILSDPVDTHIHPSVLIFEVSNLDFACISIQLSAKMESNTQNDKYDVRVYF